MRTCLCLCALLVPSAACGGRIEITGVIANYVTTTDEFEIEIQFDRAFDPARDYVEVMASLVVGKTYWLVIDNGTIRNGLPTDIGEPFMLERRTSSPLTMTPLGPLAGYETGLQFMAVIDDFSTKLTRDIDRPIGISASIRTAGNLDLVDRWSGIASVNDRRLLRHTPEPSSVVLASFGVVAMMVHFSRLRRQRFRRTKLTGTPKCAMCRICLEFQPVDGDPHASQRYIQP